jgi:hypothetical protein
MERRERWATYYSGNSAALAHYHLALSGAGVAIEPYPRPASPPMPPQMMAAAADVVSAAAPAAASAAAVASPAMAATAASVAGGGGGGAVTVVSAAAKNLMSINIAPTKKKRWALSDDAAAAATTTAATSTPSTLLDLEKEAIRRSVVGGDTNDTNNNGKSSSKSSSTKSILASSSSAAAAAAAGRGANNRRGDTSLYLDKFVEEKSTPGAKRNHAMMESRINDTISSFSSSPLSKKIKNTAVGISYYGPSSSRNDEDADDYVPLALNQPLGYTKKEQQKKKSQKKNIYSSGNNNVSGFDANETALIDRARRFQGQGGIDSASFAPTTIANVEKYMGKATIGGSMKQLDEGDYERMTVKGTCAVLEKNYLRLTSPPKAELVRPQRILEEHLSQLKRSYYHIDDDDRGGGGGGGGRVHNGRQRGYSWYCSQMKAIRQDLTVQRIINAFAVDVYETHAKMALEEDDINEYNQSQTQLKELYDLIERRRQRVANYDGNGGSGKTKAKRGKEKPKKNKKVSNKCGGKKKEEEEEEEEDTDTADDDDALKNRNEFIAYRIIYYVFLSGNKKYEGGSSDIFKVS